MQKTIPKKKRIQKDQKLSFGSALKHKVFKSYIKFILSNR